MPRKKKKKLNPLFINAIKYGFVILLLVGVGTFTVKKSLEWIVGSEYFQVRKITIDPSLKVIGEKDVKKLRGQSIFHVDLNQLHNQLRKKYPQIVDLKIMRSFPNEILVLAKERKPFAQWLASKATVTMDENGYVISLLTKQDRNIPLIVGVEKSEDKVSLGSAVKHNHIQTALRIIKLFHGVPGLTPYKVEKIDVTHLSKITLHLNDSIKVFIDWDDIRSKMQMLGLILSELHMDLEFIDYIDLRFKEPVIGRKN